MKAFFPAASCAALSLIVLAGNDPVLLPPLRVTESPVSAFTPASVREGRDELARSLAAVPGVSFASRGPAGGEPVLRGLGWERVRTDFNGLSLHGACPGRMDPPASQLSSASVQEVHVDLGDASVLEGPGGLAGRIRLSTVSDWNPAGPRPPLTRAEVLAGSNGGLLAASAASRVESQQARLHASGAAGTRGDYVSGNGTRVPAGRRHWELGLDASFLPAESLLLDLALRRIEERDVDYPGLPMDARSTDMNLFTLDTRWTTGAEALKSLEFRIGLQQVDHLMDNRDRPNRPMMRAETPSSSDSLGGRLLSRWHSGAGELRAGTDASRVEREATRRRHMPASGMTAFDPIWADLREEQTGLFGEWEGPLRDGLNLRAGLRIDRVESRVGSPGTRINPAPGIGPLTLRESYTRLGEARRGQSSNADDLLSGNVRLQQGVSEDWSLSLGLIRAAAAPNLSQRYDGFAARPGGYGLGNPDLEPEVKHQIELRVEGRHGSHQLGAALHAARVDDYIKPTLIGRRDITGDGNPDAVFSHRNVDAVLYGMELSAALHLSDTWSIPAQLSLVRGEECGGGDLPGIPPLEGSAALRWERDLFIQLGADFAARQNRIDPSFGEKETPGFAVAHLRLGAELRPGLRIEAGVENLFDTNHVRHLTRDAVMAGGDLRPGDRIPEPGRSFTLALRADW